MKSSSERAINVLIIMITVLVSAYAMSPSIADPDLWGHVQFGRDFLKTGELETTTSYSFTAEGYRWINHENLSEISMAWVVEQFGAQGLLWGKFLLSLLVIGTILFYNLRSKAGLIPSCVLTLFVAWNLGYHWSFRPQLSSFVMFTLMILGLQLAFTNWRGHWHLPWFQSKWLVRQSPEKQINQPWLQAKLLWLLPVILVIWTNSHGGFVAGVCIFVAYLGCRSIEAFSSLRPSRGQLLRLFMVMSVAILVTFVNPYSYRLPAWLLESLGTPRPEISDWSSHMLFSGIGMKFWGLIGLVVFALAFSKRSLDFTELVVLGLTLWQAVSHFRHVPFFAIAAGFWIGPHLREALSRFEKSEEAAKTVSNQLHPAFGIVMVLIVGLIGFRMADRLSELKVDRQQFPVEAFQFMADNRLGGNLVVTYDWAQYAIAAFCVEENLADGQPLSKVAFDGRFRTCYPQEVVDMHFDLLFGNNTERSRSPDSPPIDPTRVLRHGSPDLVLIKRHGEVSSQVMETQQDKWVLLFQDQISQLWGRADRYDQLNSSDYLSAESRIIGNASPTGYATWPAFPINRITASPVSRLANRTPESTKHER